MIFSGNADIIKIGSRKIYGIVGKAILNKNQKIVL